MKIKGKFLFVIAACVINFLASCVINLDDKYIDASTELSMDFSGSGDFIIVNTNKDDTLLIKGSKIKSEDLDKTLEAHNGNRIKIRFEPKEEYKNYSFETSYTLPNDSTVENKLELEYVIGDTLEGSHNIYMNAKTEHENVDLTTYGAFTLKIIK